ncbi:MAG: DUF2911 domain-containing protein [Bacteroidales bacterium]
MKRLTSFVAVVIFVAAVAAGVAAQQQQSNPTAPPQMQQQPAAAAAPRMPASPRGLAATQVGGKWEPPAKPGDAPRATGWKWITVDYGRPILRGRTDIFGSGPEYGKKVNDDGPVWRVGANQTTRFKTEVPLVFGGKTLPAGEYSMFVDLKPGAWTLIFSNQPYQTKYDPNNKAETWGAYNYDSKFDVLTVPMKVSKSAVSVDQFNIEFINMTAGGGTLMMVWETTAASVPFKVAQ